jgi:xylulokinase
MNMLMGLDVGSTGAKAVVFDEQGTVRGSAYQEYPEVYPRPGWIELRPDQVWAATREVIRRAAAEAGGGVRSLCISALGETFTPVAEDGQFLCNSIVSPDTRAVKQAESWRETLGARRVFEITGMPLHPSFTLNKIMWLRDEMPEVHAATWKHLLWPDLIFLMLGLEPRIDWSLAGRTMAFDVVARRWSDEMLEAAGIEASMFAQPIRPGEVVGELAPAAADEVGLEAGCLVVAGGHDQPMNALGAGIIEPGLAVDGMGTVECITVAFDEPVLTGAMLEHNYCCYPHVAGDLYATIAFNYSSGSVLRWFRDTFGEPELAQARREGRDVYEVILEDLPEGPTGLLWIPYFAGSGTPYLDPHARGAILGLTLDVDRKRFIKALIEGTCYELNLNITALAEAGVQIDRLRATGGGSKSDAWLQLKADITGKEVVTLNVSEAGCLAGAMLGGVALGLWASVTEAVGALVREQRTFQPRPEEHASYQALYGTYADAWPALADVVHRIQADHGPGSPAQ